MKEVTITRAQLDRWLARLRAPTSKQMRYLGASTSPGYGYDALQGHEPMCCLVHGTYVLKLNSQNYYPEMCKLIGDIYAAHLQKMNDEYQEPLPAIANWIEANIQPVD